MAPKAAEKNMATSDAPVKEGERKSSGSTNGLRLCRQCKANSSSTTTAATSTPTMEAEDQPPVRSFDQTEGQKAHPVELGQVIDAGQKRSHLQRELAGGHRSS